MSVTVQHAADLSAHYVREAGLLILQSEFGEALKTDLCILAIERCHHLNFNLDPFLAFLLEPSPTREPRLHAVLSALPAEHLPSSYLRLLNASTKDDKALADRVKGILQDFLPELHSEPLREELAAMLDKVALSELLGRGDPIDPAAVLEEWESRRALWIYPSVLNLLLSHGYETDGLMERAAWALHRDGRIDSYNVWLLLAITAAYRLQNATRGGDLLSKAGAYIKQAYRRWEGQLSTEHNLRTFKLLYVLDPSNQSVYLEKVRKWQYEKMRMNYVVRFPRLASEGGYFPIFEDYVHSMRFFGLALDTEPAEFDRLMGFSPPQKLARADAWLASAAAVPEAIVESSHGKSVGTEFLSLGHCFFTSPGLQDARFQDARRQFNQAARRHLPDLLSLMGRLPEVPPEIRALLQAHNDRLLRSDAPPEPGRKATGAA
jgi:hypothetical protein